VTWLEPPDLSPNTTFFRRSALVLWNSHIVDQRWATRPSATRKCLLGREEIGDAVNAAGSPLLANHSWYSGLGTSGFFCLVYRWIEHFGFCLGALLHFQERENMWSFLTS